MHIVLCILLCKLLCDCKDSVIIHYPVNNPILVSLTVECVVLILRLVGAYLYIFAWNEINKMAVNC